MKLIPNHPDLPPLPEGQFWRIKFKYPGYGMGIEYVNVDLRQKWWRISFSIEHRHALPDEKTNDQKHIAIWLAKRIIKNQNKKANTLGDLKGDHP